MIVRELIALFGAQVDRNSFAQGTREFARFQHEVQSRMFRLRTAVGTVVGVTVGSMLGDWAEDAARFADAEAMLTAAGGSIDDLRKKTRGLIDDMTLVKTANLAQGFGLGEYYADLVLAADAAAKKFGGDQNKMLESLIMGIARKSPARLDNTGLLITKAEVEKHAASLGKNYEDLAPQEKVQMYASLAVEQSRKTIAEMRKAGATSSDVFDQLKTSQENAKLAIGQMANVLLINFMPAILQAGNLVRDLAVAFSFVDEEAGKSKTAVQIVGELTHSLIYGLRIIPEFIKGNQLLVKTVMGLLLLIPVKAAILGIGRALMTAVPLVNYLSKAFAIGAINQWGFLAVLTKLQTLFYGMVTTGVIIAIALALEEMFSVFDKDKMGLFEEFTDHWHQLSEEIYNQEGALASLYGVLLLVIAGYDDLGKWIFRGAEDKIELQNGLGEADFDGTSEFEKETNRRMVYQKKGLLKQYDLLKEFRPSLFDNGLMLDSVLKDSYKEFMTMMDAKDPGRVTEFMKTKAEVNMTINGANMNADELATKVGQAVEMGMNESLKRAVEEDMPEGELQL